MRLTSVLVVASVCSGAFASQPGQPLDCSDWVFLEPGLSCTEVLPHPCLNASQTDFLIGCLSYARHDSFDNQGRQLITRQDGFGTRLNCDGLDWDRKRLTIWAVDASGVETLLAYQLERCGPTGSGNVDTLGLQAWAFDSVNGVFRITTFLTCFPGSCYDNGMRVVAIHGFAPMFEVLQSYTPQPALAFRVPCMPEGMAGADHFDTYWGPLAHPIDFTQAHPLQCGYPAATPHVGDYLAVADTVPTPAPGQGVYYVTAATYQGATRYGRKTTAGHLSGRDPEVLPACETP